MCENSWNRVVGLDIVRSCAIFFVIAGHFFVLHTPFEETKLDSVSIFVQATALQLFYTSVPLFLILTGYLNANKTISRKYYSGIWRVLVAYVFFSIITVLFRKYYLHEDESLYRWIYKILNYSAIPYAWYIEMWIGIFLMSPFLNVLYRALPTRKHKQLLVITAFVMTALPLSWYHVFPQYWMKCFPVFYYFVGSYIREYQPMVKTRYLIIAAVVCCLTNPLYKFLDKPALCFGGGVNGLFGSVLAVVFFLLVYKTDINNRLLKGVLSRVSILSLDMYLCCYIFDAIFYPWFKEKWFVDQAQFGGFFFIIVPLVFFTSFVFAQIKECVFTLCRVNKLFLKYKG